MGGCREIMTSDQRLDEVSLKALVDAIPDAVVVLECDRRIVVANTGAEEASRFTAKLLGQRCHEAFYGRRQPCQGPFSSCPVQQVIECGRAVETVHRFVDAEGRVRVVRLTVSPVKDQAGRIVGLVEVRKDISSTLDDEARLRFLTHYDPLTGLLKRRSFMAHVLHWIQGRKEHVERITLARVRLVAYDRYVESFGSSAAEHILKVFAERLQAWSVVGALFGYDGSADFLVALPLTGPDIGPDQARHLVDSVVREPVEVASRDVYLRASTGVATAEIDGADPDELLRRATADLARSPRDDRAGSDGMKAAGSGAERRIELESHLRAAVNNGALRIAYQPQFGLATGHLRGFEALLRWPRCRLGCVGPAQFVPVLEEAGLIGQVTEWIVEESAALLREWRSRNLLVPKISVNVPASLFVHEELVDTVRRVMEENRALGSGWLEFEVTESGIMSHIDRAVATMKTLAGLGVTIAVDDFGVGYSSLGYLQKLPIHGVKIDRAFVSQIRSSESDHAIVSAIVAMAHHLGLEVIAEGVEHAGQRAVLRELGVDAAQGFLFSRAVPEREVADYLASVRPSTG